jgi:hypothetical protein
MRPPGRHGTKKKEVIMWYTFVGAYAPAGNWRSERDALGAWQRFVRLGGATRASNVRLLGCDTRRLARTADISEIRVRERIVAVM